MDFEGAETTSVPSRPSSHRLSGISSKLIDVAERPDVRAEDTSPEFEGR